MKSSHVPCFDEVKPTVRKNHSSDREKTFEIQGWRPRICKFFEITRTICWNGETSEQFWVTECFFNLFLEVSQTKYELEFKFEKIVGIYKDAGKIRKFYSYLEMNICISEWCAKMIANLTCKPCRIWMLL